MSLSHEDQKIIAVIGETIYGMALGDIHRALGCNYPTQKITKDAELKDGQCLVGALMLAVAIIEAIGHHCCASNTSHSAEDAFTRFSEDYLRKIEPRYVTKNLWQVMRNGLLHNYSTRHNYGTNPVKYALIKNASNAHLEPVPNKSGYFYMNIQSFIADIDAAVNRFLDELEKDGSTEQTETILWINTNSAMTVFPALLSNGGICLVDTASGVSTAAEIAQNPTFLIGSSPLQDKNRLFTQLPSWKSADRNRSIGGHFLK